MNSFWTFRVILVGKFNQMSELITKAIPWQILTVKTDSLSRGTIHKNLTSILTFDPIFWGILLEIHMKTFSDNCLISLCFYLVFFGLLFSTSVWFLFDILLEAWKKSTATSPARRSFQVYFYEFPRSLSRITIKLTATYNFIVSLRVIYIHFSMNSFRHHSAWDTH